MTQFTGWSRSSEETRRWANDLAQHLKPGDVLALEGDLGAGKTTFTKGLAQGLGVKRTVNSPTFTIVKEYVGRLPFYHIDAYRLEDAGEELGFEEYLEGGGVTVVEWPTRIDDLLPSEILWIELKRLKREDERQLLFQPQGRRFVRLCEEWVGS